MLTLDISPVFLLCFFVPPPTGTYIHTTRINSKSLETLEARIIWQMKYQYVYTLSQCFHTSVKKTLKTSFKSHHLKVILLTKRHGTNVSYICIIMKQKWSAYTKPVHLSYVKIKNACFIYIFHYNDDGWFFSSTFLSENFITFEV